MDRPLEKPGNRLRARVRRNLFLAVMLLMIVLGVASLPPVVLYFLGLSQGESELPARESSSESETYLYHSIVNSFDGKRATAPVTAFVDVNVVPMDSERVISGQTVVIRDCRITAIGPSETVELPENALKIDGRGKYLLPGLVDMHVHVTDPIEFLLYLANGVTTVCDLGGAPGHLEWRDRLARGEMIGPTLYVSGPPLRGLKTVVEAVRAVTEQKHAGYDLIKIYSPPDWTQEAYATVTAAARKYNIRTIGHLGRNLPLDEVLSARQDAVAHAEEYLYTYFFKLDDPAKSSDARIPYVVGLTKDAGTSVIGTLVAYNHIGLMVGDGIHELMRKPELEYVPRAVQEQWSPENNQYRKRFAPSESSRFLSLLSFQKRLLKAMHGAGVRLMLGTDASRSMPFVLPGFSAHQELQELVGAGLTPYEALRAGTAAPGQFLRTVDEFGAVAVGNRADLLLVTANPLENIANAASIAGVMARGHWFSKSDLQWMLEAIAASHTSDMADFGAPRRISSLFFPAALEPYPGGIIPGPSD